MGDYATLAFPLFNNNARMVSVNVGQMSLLLNWSTFTTLDEYFDCWLWASNCKDWFLYDNGVRHERVKGMSSDLSGEEDFLVTVSEERHYQLLAWHFFCRISINIGLLILIFKLTHFFSYRHLFAAIISMVCLFRLIRW